MRCAGQRRRDQVQAGGGREGAGRGAPGRSEGDPGGQGRGTGAERQAPQRGQVGEALILLNVPTHPLGAQSGTAEGLSAADVCLMTLQISMRQVTGCL